jgi:hypothetical protein
VSLEWCKSDTLDEGAGQMRREKSDSDEKQCRNAKRSGYQAILRQPATLRLRINEGADHQRRCVEQPGSYPELGGLEGAVLGYKSRHCRIAHGVHEIDESHGQKSRTKEKRMPVFGLVIGEPAYAEQAPRNHDAEKLGNIMEYEVRACVNFLVKLHGKKHDHQERHQKNNESDYQCDLGRPLGENLVDHSLPLSFPTHTG